MHKEDCLLYESGEMTPAKAAEFEQHLASCTECREWLVTVREAHRWAVTLAHKPSQRLAQVVLGRGNIRKSVDYWTALRPLSLALAALLIVFYVSQKPSSIPQWDTSDLHATILHMQSNMDGMRSEINQAQQADEIGAHLKNAEQWLNEIKYENDIVKDILKQSP